MLFLFGQDAVKLFFQRALAAALDEAMGYYLAISEERSRNPNF